MVSLTRRQAGVGLVLLAAILGVGAGVVHHTDSAPVVRAIPVDVNGSPSGIVVIDPRSGHVFVAGDAGGTVSLLDARNGALLTTTNVGTDLAGMAVDQTTGQILAAFSANSAGVGSVSFLDTHSGALLHTVFVGQHASAVAVDSRTAHAFVTNTGDDSVSMLDLHSRRVQRTIPVGFSPVDVAVDERTEHVFVANDGSNSVSMLDARRPTLYEGNYVLGLRIPDAFLQGVEAGSAANH